MENSKLPATQGDIAELRREMQELEARLDTRFQAFGERVEGLFKRMEAQIVATVYRLGDAAQMRLTEAEREAAAVKERLSTLEQRLMEIERLIDMKTQRLQ
jgi:flagellar motility protein MotE (MotC chaperone)